MITWNKFKTLVTEKEFPLIFTLSMFQNSVLSCYRDFGEINETALAGERNVSQMYLATYSPF